MERERSRRLIELEWGQLIKKTKRVKNFTYDRPSKFVRI